MLYQKMVGQIGEPVKKTIPWVPSVAKAMFARIPHMKFGRDSKGLQILVKLKHFRNGNGGIGPTGESYKGGQSPSQMFGWTHLRRSLEPWAGKNHGLRNAGYGEIKAVVIGLGVGQRGGGGRKLPASGISHGHDTIGVDL